MNRGSPEAPYSGSGWQEASRPASGCVTEALAFWRRGSAKKVNACSLLSNFSESFAGRPQPLPFCRKDRSPNPRFLLVCICRLLGLRDNTRADGPMSHKCSANRLVTCRQHGAHVGRIVKLTWLSCSGAKTMNYSCIWILPKACAPHD